MLAALFSTFQGTPMWDSLPSVVSTIQQAVVNSAHTMNAQTGEKYKALLLNTAKKELWSRCSCLPTIFQICMRLMQVLFFSSELLYVIQQPLSSLLTGIFHVMNTSSFTAQSFVGGLPQALVSTAEAALQVRTTFLSTDVVDC